MTQKTLSSGKMIRTRFAPSPTGYLHIGGVRTALYNWLYAKKYGGQFILRIDDTDSDRNLAETVQPILDGFRWLGLNWDEGPEVGGPHGPYFQSQRKDKYDAVLQLLKRGAAYEDDGAIRLLMGKNGTIELDDLVRGKVTWERRLIKDPVIVRRDGQALYNFATVVDDHDMQISHIFRAEEHLSNTPIQLRIYEALEWCPPKFGHLPFVCAPGTKKKLSKRDMERFMTDEVKTTLKSIGYTDDEIISLNPATLAYYKAMGYLPDAVNNYLALIGWSKDGATELFTRDELLKDFDIQGINKAPGAFDPEKFRFINSEHIKKLSLEKRTEYCYPFLDKANLIKDWEECEVWVAEKVKEIVPAMGDRLKLLSDILAYGGCFFRDPIYDEKAFDKRVKKERIPALLKAYSDEIKGIEFNHDSLEVNLQQFAQKNDVKFGDMVHALRISFTGQPVGFSLFDAMIILGVDECCRRISMAIEKAA